MLHKILKLAISIAIPLLIGFVGSIFTSMSVDTWYPLLKKPVFNPPNWIFGPVWTLLFILMGLSFYLVWQKGFGGKALLCIGIFALQLLFNFLWSLFFFGLRNPLLAFVDLTVLWILIWINLLVFFRIVKLSGYLLIPYLAWVTFAGILNYSIYVLNNP